MKISTFLNIVCVLTVLLSSCTKENTTPTPASNLQANNSIGFRAQVINANSAKKNWRTTSTNSNQTAPVSGVDYFAIRGGINPEELTLMSFGKFTEDTSSIIGRLTIFISNVSDTGTYNIDGANSNNAVLSILNNNNLAYYSTDKDNQGAIVVTKYDTINNTISGTFGFKLVSSGNIVTVQNGIFTDIPFKQ